MEQTEEIWKDIPDWEGYYQVSNLGRVRGCPRKVYAPNRWGACWRTYPQRILKPRPTNHYGHLTVGLARNGKSKPYLVHRLVCAAFHGPCPADKEHCAHWDGDKLNNRPENLRWATAKENAADTKRHGNMKMGEDSNLSRLSEDDVLAIRAKSAGGQSGYSLAKEYQMTSAGIYKIIKRENWKHI